MARQPDIRYVQIYNYGSAAPKLEPLQPKKKKTALPKPKVRKKKQRVIHVDPLSLCALAAAGLLLVTMVIGMIHFGIEDSRGEELQTYVERLQEENTQLRKEYESNYDPQQVYQQAKDQGMIPVSQAERVRLELVMPQQPSEPGIWEQIQVFFTELFA